VELGIDLWNKHIDEMDAALNRSRAEFERLHDEAEALRKRTNRASRACPNG
jgi:hypothetical protein